MSTPNSLPRPRVALGAAVFAVAAALVAGPAAALDPADLARLELAQQEVTKIGAAITNWAFDHGPVSYFLPAEVDVSLVPTIGHAALTALLVPVYSDSIPELDPWGNPYEFRLDTSWNGSGPFGGVRSAGADGTFDGDVYPVGDTLQPGEDLMRWNGFVVRRLGPPFLSELEARFRTLQDLTVVNGGFFGWYIEQTGSLPPEWNLPEVDITRYQPISRDDLRAEFAPHGARVPITDGWGETFDYYLDLTVEPPVLPPFFAVRSRGRGGVADAEIYPSATYPPNDRDRDVVLAEAQFLYYPDLDALDGILFVDGFESGDARFWSALSP